MLSLVKQGSLAVVLSNSAEALKLFDRLDDEGGRLVRDMDGNDIYTGALRANLQADEH